MPKGKPLWKRLAENINRGTITFLVNESVGVTIVLHELFLREQERPFFLALAGALMGLPFMLSADKKIRGEGEG